MRFNGQPSAAVNQTKRFEKARIALNAAALVFNERGVTGATFADVADKVGGVPKCVTCY